MCLHTFKAAILIQAYHLYGILQMLLLHLTGLSSVCEFHENKIR